MSAPVAVLLAHYPGYLLQFRGALIRELVCRGYRMIVVVPGATEHVRCGVAALGAECRQIELSRTGLNPIADLAYAKRVRVLLRELRPDLVIATGIKPILYGIPEARGAGVPMRVSFFAGLGSMFRPESRLHRVLSVVVRPLLRRALQCSTHVVTQNCDDARVILTGFESVLQRPPITTEGSGVDLSQFAVEPMPEKPMVLMMARIVPEKGVGEFLEAARLVRMSAPHVQFVMAGFFESRARGLRRERFLADCADAGVDYIGHVDDVRGLLQVCSVFVLPSYHEGRPRTIQEALAAGRPVVTTDAPGCRDSIEDGTHGRIVPMRNAEALAAAIGEVLELAMAAGTAQACRRYAEARYCSKRIARRLLDSVGAPARHPEAT